MTTQLRVLTGLTALAAGLCFLAGAVAAPPLAKDTLKKAAEADIAQLHKHLKTCEEDAKEAKRFGPTAMSIAMVLALYGEASGDKELKSQALKVAEAISAKNYKEAAAAAKGLAVKPGAAPLPAGEVAKFKKYGLDEVMSPFRAATVGGLNIEKDIRGIRDGKIPVKSADVELLAARTASLLHFAEKMPNDKATVNKKNQEEWDNLSRSSVEICKKLTDEAAKPKPNEKEIVKLIKGLDAKCVDCHDKFRD